VHNYATVASQLIHTNAPKRSLYSTGSLSAKRQRRPFPSSHLVNSTAVDMVIQNMIRAFPDMSISCERPFGAPVVLQVTVGRTLKAVVTLRGLVIEWVTVKAFHEDLRLENGKIDLWSNSKYLVFQKLTTHTRSAMLHFYSPHIQAVDQAIKSFLMWLQSYKTLFTAPCRKCSRLLQDNLPPTWRDLRTFEPYHEQCRP
jgi:mediator of RNA polymerase II transcription subunit 27